MPCELEARSESGSCSSFTLAVTIIASVSKLAVTARKAAGAHVDRAVELGIDLGRSIQTVINVIGNSATQILLRQL